MTLLKHEISTYTTHTILTHAQTFTLAQKMSQTFKCMSTHPMHEQLWQQHYKLSRTTLRQYHSMTLAKTLTTTFTGKKIISAHPKHVSPSKKHYTFRQHT